MNFYRRHQNVLGPLKDILVFPFAVVILLTVVPIFWAISAAVGWALPDSRVDWL